MMGSNPHDSDHLEFVEVDPTGRYGRYNEILGKGASKTVYRAFDEYEGIEVAWNQVKLYDFLQSPDDLERLYCEIHLLKTLKHRNIMKFYTSWVDISKRNINFVTEMFTSGTLRQYRNKHKRVHIRAVKHWCRQILMGLLYLHSHDPPVIHRDLKCDNIFVNGNHGEVKIGDLGLAAILRQSHAVHCVGTPEFMAPEVYEEEYNELVDIYSFGMCVLEMVTFEYPYSECTHPAQIYKKVISGIKPDALYRVKDSEVRQFIEKCLASASERLTARELLQDPFLRSDDIGSGYLEPDIIDMAPISRQPSSYSSNNSNGYLIANGFPEDLRHESEMDNEWDGNSADFETHGIDLFNKHENEDEDETFGDVDITIKGRKDEDGSIFVRLRIGDKEGHVRNIYFPFDIESDTAIGVAAEMVDELDITDHEVTRIAEMIDGEVSSLVPDWKAELNSSNVCCPNLHSSDSQTECGEMHGRFEEITYQDEGSEHSLTEGAPVLSSQESGESLSDEDRDQLGAVDEPRTSLGQQLSSEMRSDECENKIPQDLKWLKLKYQIRVREFRNRLLGRRRATNLSLDLDKERMVSNKDEGAKVTKHMKSFHLGTRFSFKHPDIRTEHCMSSQPHEEEAMSYYNSDSLPISLPRARSLYLQ